MSYNKNTLNLSLLNFVVNTLDNLNVSYNLIEIGKIKGMGLNDYNEEYPIRRLEYSDNVILECIERDCDCDVDDVILSVEFKLKDEPEDWEIEKRCSCGGCEESFINEI